MIIDREQEIREFVPEEYWSIDGNFKKKTKKFKANFWGVDGKRKITKRRSSQRDHFSNRW